MNEFRIRNASGYERPSDWQDRRRPRAYERPKFLSEDQIQTIKNTIITRDPDILLLTEIIDLASLRMFASNSKYLNGVYEIYVHPVNQLGSNIAFLVKRGLPLNIEFESHIHASRVDPSGETRRIFTRDIPALLIRAQGDDKSDNVVVLLGVHAKSERKAESSNGMESVDIWYHEMVALNQIRETYRAHFPNAKIGIIGDINADVEQSGLYNILKQMVSFLSLQGLSPDDPRRATHVSFLDGRALARQRDDMLVDSTLFNFFVGGRVVPFMDIQGNPKPNPNSWQERDKYPTDHKMIEAIFNFFKIFFGKVH